MRHYIPDPELLALALENHSETRAHDRSKARRIIRARERLIAVLVTGELTIPPCAMKTLLNYMQSDACTEDQASHFEATRRLWKEFEREPEYSVIPGFLTDYLIQQQQMIYTMAAWLAEVDLLDEPAYEKEAAAFVENYEADDIQARVNAALELSQTKAHHKLVMDAKVELSTIHADIRTTRGELKEAFKRLRELKAQLAEYLPEIELLHAAAFSGAILLTNNFNYCYLSAAQQKVGLVHAQVDWDFRAGLQAIRQDKLPDLLRQISDEDFTL